MLIIPIVYLWTGIRPFIISSFYDLLSYQLPVFLVLMGITRWFAPDSYMPIVSTAVSLFTSFRIIPTVLATVIKPFGTPFRVTPKGSNVVSSFGDRTVLWMACVLAILTIGGLVINRISPYPSLGDRAYLTAAEVGALFNLVLLALVALMSIESPRPRNKERFPVERPGLCRIRGQELPCIITNISETGALLDVPVRVDSGEAVELKIEGVGLFSAETVRNAWSKIAIRFRGNPNE
jgi:cellulose synthase (UDP-forming)